MIDSQRLPLLSAKPAGKGRSTSDGAFDEIRPNQSGASPFYSMERRRSNRDEYVSMLGYVPLVFEDAQQQQDYLTSSPGTLLRKTSQRGMPQRSWIPAPGSVRGSIFNLAGATLGAGALSLPYAFAVSGMVCTLIQLIVAALLTVYTIRLLIHASEMTGLKSYEDLALYCFGKCGAVFVEINILVFCFSIAVAYLVTLGDIITPLGQDLFGLESFFGQRWVLMSIFCSAIMLPLSLLRDISSLQFSSILGVLSIIFLVLSVSYRSLELVSKDGVNKSIHWGVNTSNGVNVVLSAPIIMFAFTCQVNVFSIYTELQRPNIRRMNKVVDRATSISLLIYVAIGVCAYLAFGSSLIDPENKGNILLSFGSKDALIAVCRAAITFTVSVAFPLNIFPCRFTLEMMFFSNWPASTIRHAVISTLLVACALALAIFCPSINVIFGIIGGTCSSIVCFAVPAAFMVRLVKGPLFTFERMQYVILLVLSVVLGLFSTVVTIWSSFFAAS